METLKEQITKHSSVREELKTRAKRVNYKNKIPTLPLTPSESTMSGYFKRFNNWERQLIVLEGERKVQLVKQNSNLLANYVSA